MNKERTQSLFLPRLAIVLFILIFLSGISEAIFIITYQSKHATEISNLVSENDTSKKADNATLSYTDN